MSHPGAAPPRISVLIPAYNEERLIGGVLDSVHESFRACDLTDYEVVVCDNNSTDATGSVAQTHGARVVFEPHNQISRARNAAAGSATGEWFIFLDGDTMLNAAALKETVEALAGGKQCGGGATLSFDQPDLGPFAGGITKLWNWISRTFNLAAGSYLFCLKDAWKDTGGFSSEVYAGEELFFSRQVKQWGKPRGLRFQVLRHATIVTSARKMVWYGQWELLWHVLLMMRPTAMKRREACGLWYTRPADTPKSPG